MTDTARTAIATLVRETIGAHVLGWDGDAAIVSHDLESDHTERQHVAELLRNLADALEAE